MTDAERRAAEVRARRAPREPRDPAVEAQRIADRELDQWIDEGSVRDAADAAVERAIAPRRRPVDAEVDPEVRSELADLVGAQRAARLAERLAKAADALERDRFQEARRVAGAVAKEVPGVARAHEIYALASYRLGLFRDAVRGLEVARDLQPDPALLPVLADSYRALRRWSAVEETWLALRNASPAHEVMAEGRIVAASALADRGDLRGALEMMQPATAAPKRVRDHHLRQWYVLGDLHDRSGDAIAARRWFRAVADHDPEFGDIRDRLRGLGS